MLGWRRPTSAEIAALVTVVAVAVVMSVRGGTMFSPGALNAQNRGNAPLGGVHSHADIGGNCAACHAPTWSGETMASRCLNCHADVRAQLDTHGPMHGMLADGGQCRTCHSEHRGAEGILTSFERFDHDCTAFKLTGKHRALECQSCHANQVYKGTAQSCVACHAEPVVHKGRFGTNCASCHSTNTWQLAPDSLTTAKFNHDLTGFKLTGKHTAVECQACHVNNVFKGTSQACVSCHADPVVHKGNFGTNCASCHTTDTWKQGLDNLLGGKFDHNLAAFKLTGKHKTVECKACHVNNVFKGTAQTCVSCHADPVVHKGRFGTNCASCHSTDTWKLGLDDLMAGKFDHNLTAFKLTGKHTTVECKACHVNNVIKGTAQACLGCHAEPAVHKGKFGTNCVQCHTTLTWKGATFAHKFPLTHRNKGKEIACAVCHKGDDGYKTYTCYGCHAHEQTRMERKHPRVDKLKLPNCVKCHPTGRERGALDTPRPDLWAFEEQNCTYEVAQACPRSRQSDPLKDLLMNRIKACEPAAQAKGEAQAVNVFRQGRKYSELVACDSPSPLATINPAGHLKLPAPLADPAYWRARP